MASNLEVSADALHTDSPFAWALRTTSSLMLPA
jgi:hypothetical protein